MFESANLDHRIAKAAFQREERKLREALLHAQYDLLRDAFLYGITSSHREWKWLKP